MSVFTGGAEKKDADHGSNLVGNVFILASAEREDQFAVVSDYDEKAFAAPFREPHLIDVFRQRVEDSSGKYRKTPDKYIGPYLTMFNGSMIGKSRLLVAAAQTMYSLVLCLRPLSSSNETPKRSPHADYLEKPTQRHEIFYFTYLLAWIAEFSNWYRDEADSSTPKPQAKPKSKAKPKTEAKARTPADWQQHVQSDTVQGRVKESAQRRLRDSDFSLPAGSNSLPLFSVFLDEARCLVVRDTSDLDSPTRFRLFRRALAKFRAPLPQVFAVFTDTLSRLTDFAPPVTEDPSGRHFGSTKETPAPKLLFEPFFELKSFDAFAPALPAADADHAQLVQQLQPSVLYRYGRCAWGAYLDSGMSTEDLRNTAMRKLMCGAKTLGDLDRDKARRRFAELAILASRLCLEVVPGRGAAAELIGGHMAVCVGISKDRNYVFQAYPSEPVLADAARCLWYERKEAADTPSSEERKKRETEAKAKVSHSNAPRCVCGHSFPIGRWRRVGIRIGHGAG